MAAEHPTTNTPCQIHPRHLPKSHVNQRHFVWPLEDGGPETDENLVVVCATGRANIQKLMVLLRVTHGMVPYAESRTYSWHERRIARLGYQRMMRRSM